MAVKYTVKPRWASNDAIDPITLLNNVIEPSEGKKDSGWNYQEKPARNYFNWLGRQTHDWIDYFDDELNQFACHAQAIPDMTVEVDPGRVRVGNSITTIASQTTSAFTAPTTNPRIDRVVVDVVTGVYSVIAGAESATPSAPALTEGKKAIAQIALTVGMTEITNDDITDERSEFDFGGSLSVYTGGKVGIFTATPDSGVDINTSLRVQNDTNNPSTGEGLEIQYYVTGGYGIVRAYDKDGTAYKGLRLAASSMSLNGSAEGKIGVHTNSPDAGLDVSTVFRVQAGTNAPTTGEGLEIAYSTTSHYSIIQSYDRDGAAYKRLDVYGNPINLNGGSGVENYTVSVGNNAPKTGHASYSNLQVGRSAWLMGGEGSGTGQSSFWLAGNGYYDGAWRVTDTGYMSTIDGGDGIAFSTDATSRSAGAAATLTNRMAIQHDGSITVGAPTGSGKGAGTLNVQNGIYANNIPVYGKVMLPTPEQIISTTTATEAWTTVNNTTLNNANATHAILKCHTHFLTDEGALRNVSMYIRKTGSGLAIGNATIAAYSRGQGTSGTFDGSADINDITVELDSNHDFDYYTSENTVYAPSFIIHLVGYYTK